MTTEELIGNMSPDLFVSSLRPGSKDDILQQLTDAVVTGSAIKDRSLVLDMLRNREQLGSTALERGVALPHGRSLAVSKLTILVGRSQKGVDFESEDGKPTHLFFMLLAPPQDTGNLYLQALGKIAELVKKDDIRAALVEADGYEQFVAVMRESGL